MASASKTRKQVLVAITAIIVVLVPLEYLRLKSPSESQIENANMTITVETQGRFGIGYSWLLHVEATGSAELTIFSSPRKTLRFQVDKSQLVKLRKSLATERFFELQDEYGDKVFDGSTTSLTVTVGDKTKTVRLHYLMNWLHNDYRKLREPSRALRILLLVRAWFHDSEAVDLRRYDQLVLDGSVEVIE